MTTQLPPGVKLGRVPAGGVLSDSSYPGNGSASLSQRQRALELVGPEGYIHGWICVFPPCGHVGSRVWHPTYGHGEVVEYHEGKEGESPKSTVEFNNGHVAVLGRPATGAGGHVGPTNAIDRRAFNQLHPTTRHSIIRRSNALYARKTKNGPHPRTVSQAWKTAMEHERASQSADPFANLLGGGRDEGPPSAIPDGSSMRAAGGGSVKATKPSGMSDFFTSEEAAGRWLRGEPAQPGDRKTETGVPVEPGSSRGRVGRTRRSGRHVNVSGLLPELEVRTSGRTHYVGREGEKPILEVHDVNHGHIADLIPGEEHTQYGANGQPLYGTGQVAVSSRVRKGYRWKLTHPEALAEASTERRERKAWSSHPERSDYVDNRAGAANAALRAHRNLLARAAQRTPTPEQVTPGRETGGTVGAATLAGMRQEDLQSLYDSYRRRGDTSSPDYRRVERELASRLNAASKARGLAGAGAKPTGSAPTQAAVTEPTHAELLEQRRKMRAQYPAGHPDRLRAERAVRQSRKERAAGITPERQREIAKVESEKKANAVSQAERVPGEDRWDRLAADLKAAGIETSVTRRPYTESQRGRIVNGVSSSMFLKRPDGAGVVEVRDKYGRNGSWLGWQVSRADREGIVQDDAPLTKKRSEAVAAIRQRLGVLPTKHAPTSQAFKDAIRANAAKKAAEREAFDAAERARAAPPAAPEPRSAEEVARLKRAGIDVAPTKQLRPQDIRASSPNRTVQMHYPDRRQRSRGVRALKIDVLRSTLLDPKGKVIGSVETPQSGMGTYNVGNSDFPIIAGRPGVQDLRDQPEAWRAAHDANIASAKHDVAGQVNARRVRAALRSAGLSATKSHAMRIKGWRNYDPGYTVGNGRTGVSVDHVSGSFGRVSKGEMTGVRLDSYAKALRDKGFPVITTKNEYGFTDSVFVPNDPAEYAQVQSLIAQLREQGYNPQRARQLAENFVLLGIALPTEGPNANGFTREAEVNDRKPRPANGASRNGRAGKGIDLSVETPGLVATPAPYGKPGGPGLYNVKGQKHSNYFEHLVQALMRGGRSKAEASAMAWAILRRWRAGRLAGGEKGHIHPEVRAAATAALGEEASKRHGHTNTLEEEALEFAIGQTLEFIDTLHQPKGAQGGLGGRFAPRSGFAPVTSPGQQTAAKQALAAFQQNEQRRKELLGGHEQSKQGGHGGNREPPAERQKIEQLREQASDDRKEAGQIANKIKSLRVKLSAVNAANKALSGTTAAQRAAKTTATTKAATAAKTTANTTPSQAASTSAAAASAKAATAAATASSLASGTQQASSLRAQIARLQERRRSLLVQARKLDKQAAAL
jgi:hypothetical protein